jgi:hypothetical protein
MGKKWYRQQAVQIVTAADELFISKLCPYHLFFPVWVKRVGFTGRFFSYAMREGVG